MKKSIIALFFISTSLFAESFIGRLQPYAAEELKIKQLHAMLLYSVNQKELEVISNFAELSQDGNKFIFSGGDKVIFFTSKQLQKFLADTQPDQYEMKTILRWSSVYCQPTGEKTFKTKSGHLRVFKTYNGTMAELVYRHISNWDKLYIMFFSVDI